MSPTLLKDGIIVALIVAVLGACFTAGWKTRDYKAQAQLAAVEEARQKAVETYDAHVLAYANTVSTIVSDTEIQNAKNTEQRAKDLAHYRALVRAAGGLRDPGTSVSGCAAPVPGANSGGSDQAASGRPLSAEASDFLLQQANLADQVVDQYLLCQAYVQDLHQKWEAFRTALPPEPAAPN